MNKKIVVVFAIVFTLFLIFSTVLMWCACFSSYAYDLLLPALLFSLISVSLIAFLIVDVFIGRRTYLFKDGSIIVGRKSKVLYTIEKAEIRSVRIITDSLAKKSLFLVFYYNKKKHIIALSSENKRLIKAFINDLKHDETKNNLEYFITYILEIFCV